MNKQLQRDLLNKQLNNNLNKQLEKGFEELFGAVFGGIDELVKDDKVSTFEQSAMEMYSYYESFIKVGFNEDQAFELLLSLIPSSK